MADIDLSKNWLMPIQEFVGTSGFENFLKSSSVYTNNIPAAQTKLIMLLEYDLGITHFVQLGAFHPQDIIENLDSTMRHYGLNEKLIEKLDDYASNFLIKENIAPSLFSLGQYKEHWSSDLQNKSEEDLKNFVESHVCQGNLNNMLLKPIVTTTPINDDNSSNVITPDFTQEATAPVIDHKNYTPLQIADVDDCFLTRQGVLNDLFVRKVKNKDAIDEMFYFLGSEPKKTAHISLKGRNFYKEMRSTLNQFCKKRNIEHLWQMAAYDILEIDDLEIIDILKDYHIKPFCLTDYKKELGMTYDTESKIWSFPKDIDTSNEFFADLLLKTKTIDTKYAIEHANAFKKNLPKQYYLGKAQISL